LIRLIACFVAVLLACVVGNSPEAAVAATPVSITPAAPIKHVVIVDQENHSFDNVLGLWCAEIASGKIVRAMGCNGATTGVLPDGAVIPLIQAADFVPDVDHTVSGTVTAINGGLMNGFGLLHGCTSTVNPSYRCYSQFAPSQIPNLTNLARNYAVSDETFAQASVTSWGSHLQLVTGSLDGFEGAIPVTLGTGQTLGPGWGCDSNLLTQWQSAPGDPWQLVPSCVPFQDGSGAFEATPVAWVPTIMDELTQAAVSWRIYQGGYGWSICPTFADCLETSEHDHFIPLGTLKTSPLWTDISSGNLPTVTYITPPGGQSQHNQESMAQGDNWIGRIVRSLKASPVWSSTAVFITYDDCGCFYDHVAPPPGMGIRVPMVIVSPFAKKGYTDSTVTSQASLLAFIEHLTGVPSLGTNDTTAYDYAGAFSWKTVNASQVRTMTQRISRGERRRIARYQQATLKDPT
jgi:phospholipase C